MAEQNSEVGRCLCGAITFKVAGDPIYNVICHCVNCKRNGGSTLHTASIFRRDQYILLTPLTSNPTDPSLPGITVYADPSTQSGQPLIRRFCSTCGSKISAITPTNDAIISVPAGILPLAGKEWRPHKEQFVKDKCGWVPEFEGVEKMMSGPTKERVEGL